MKEIKLTQGMVALIDDDDFELINGYKWRARKGRNTYYATAHVGDWREKKDVHMHNIIMKPPLGFIVDHGDHNGLNCQRYNMRICTKGQNSKNRSGYGVSKYLGVSIVKKKSKIIWEAKIFNKGKRKYLGGFNSEIEAALAYNNAAKELHGEFANLNILDSQDIRA